MMLHSLKVASRHLIAQLLVCVRRTKPALHFHVYHFARGDVRPVLQNVGTMHETLCGLEMREAQEILQGTNDCFGPRGIPGRMNLYVQKLAECAKLVTQHHQKNTLML